MSEVEARASSIVEVMARAMLADLGALRLDMDEPDRRIITMALTSTDFLAMAKAVQKRLEAAGYAVVPVEPTGGMKDAGAETYGIHNAHIGLLPQTVIDGQPSKAWRAMVGARPR